MTLRQTTRPVPHAGTRSQRGISLFGMVFWAVVISFAGLMALRVWPSLNEYFTIKQSIERIMRTEPVPTNALAVRKAFDRQKDVEYSITTISGADLEIVEEADAGLRVSFAYDKEMEVFSPVFLLVKYRGSNR